MGADEEISIYLLFVWKFRRKLLACFLNIRYDRKVLKRIKRKKKRNGHEE